jgi:hypothetical protein
MRNLMAVVIVALALAGHARAAVPVQSGGASQAVSAKACPAGFTHAVIAGEQKCLRAGEYCAHSEARQYRRYHLVCERVRGTYRLEHS